MTPTDPPMMATTGRCKAGTTKATIQFPANLKGGIILGTSFQRHPTIARSHKGIRKGPDSSINGRSGTADGVPVYGRGSALPSPIKV